TVCGKPWNQDSSPYYFTLKTSPDRTQEDIFLCRSCKMGFWIDESIFTKVYMPGHRREQRPFWRNRKPLSKSQALHPLHVSLDTYPLIEDFEVMVICWIEQQQLGKEIWHSCAQLARSSDGYLTRLLGVDPSQPDFVLPHGSLEQPAQLDAGWDTLYTLIAEDDKFVYILTDNEDFLCDEQGNRIHLYHAWCKVEKSRYYRQWEQAIYVARALFALYEQA
ncbi:MAG: hypothetical protein ACRDHZ_27035, partial [Ktedonobacteraceae bacterium]